jgi:hypothetical protein
MVTGGGSTIGTRAPGAGRLGFAIISHAVIASNTTTATDTAAIGMTFDRDRGLALGE